MPDYTNSGFDEFLSRSIDNTPRVNLNGQGPVTTSIAFDRSQTTSVIGDTITIGNVRITKTGILMSDDNGNDVLLIGDE